MVMQSNPFDQFDAPQSGGGVIVPSTPAQRQMQQDEAVRSRNAAAASAVSPAQAQAEMEMAQLRIRELEQQIAASQVEQTAEADEQKQAQTKSSIGTVQKLRQNDEMLDRIRIAREEVARPFSTGNVFGTETFASVPFAGQNAANLRNTIEGLLGTTINDKLKELKDLSPTGSSGFGNFTEKEADRLAASIAAIQQTSTPDKLLVELDRLERNYRSARVLLEMGPVGSDEEAFAEYERLAPEYGLMLQSDGGYELSTTRDMETGEVPLIEGNPMIGDLTSGRDDEAVALMGGDDGVVNITSDPPLRFSPGSGPNYTLDGIEETYSTPEDIAVAKEVQYVYNQGGTVADMVAASEKYGRPVTGARLISFQRAVDYRDGVGEYEGQNTGFATVAPAQSGRKNALQQAVSALRSTDLGEAAAGFGLGAANAATFGGIDEITGAINSLGSDNPASSEILYANLLKQQTAEESPYAYALGELAGGIGTGGVAARAAPNLARQAVSSTRRAAGTGATVGGVTGALEMNENRGAGALAGTVLGGGGGAVGPYIGRAAEGLAASPMAQSFSRLINRGNVLPQVSDAERRIGGTVNYNMDAPIARLEEMRNLGLPATLADTDPNLRALAGAAIRRDLEAGPTLRQVVDDRSRGQAARAVGAIEDNFGQIRNPRDVQRELTAASRAASEANYNLAYDKPVPDSPQIRAILQTDFGRRALRKASQMAENEGLSPSEMGLVARKDGSVGLASGSGAQMPTVRTLDYVKRAMDEVIQEGNTNPNTGLPLTTLSPLGRTMQQSRTRFVNEIDELVPEYKEARRAAQPFLQAREANAQAQNAMRPRTRVNDVSEYYEGLPEIGQEAYRGGVIDSLVNAVENTSDTRNPYVKIMGDIASREKLSTLFPDGYPRFSQIVNAERDMAATAQEVAGGSQTAQRMMTDQAFDADNMGSAFALDALGGGGVFTANNLRRPLVNAARDRMALGIGEAGQRRASEIGPILLDETLSPQSLVNIQSYAQQRANRRKNAERLGALFGASFPGVFLGGE